MSRLTQAARDRQESKALGLISDVKMTPPKPKVSILDKDGQIAKRVTELFNEVKAQSKSKEPVTPTDVPRLLEKPRSHAAEKKKLKKLSRGEIVNTGPVTTLKELAYDYDIDGKDLRRLLRKNKIDKPGGRWEWPVDSELLLKIKKLIRKSGKAKKTPKGEEN